jgi:hypothetical protein
MYGIPQGTITSFCFFTSIKLFPDQQFFPVTAATIPAALPPITNTSVFFISLNFKLFIGVL